MSAVATSERRASAASVPARPARRLFESEPGRVSLEAAILRIWSQLDSEGRAACPVCAHPIEAGAACGACGSELS
jgi:hypothetical protein